MAIRRTKLENVGIIETYFGSLMAGELNYRNLFFDGDGKVCYADRANTYDGKFTIVKRNSVNNYSFYKYSFNKGDGGEIDYPIQPSFMTYHNGYGYGLFKYGESFTSGGFSFRRYTFYVYKFDLVGNIVNNWLIDEEQNVLYPDFHILNIYGYEEDGKIYIVSDKRDRDGKDDNCYFRYWTFDLATETLIHKVDFTKQKYYIDTLDSGTAESGTATTLTDTNKAWTTNQWLHKSIYIIAGTGEGQSGRIKSNTTTQITLESGTRFDVPPDATSQYIITSALYSYPIQSFIEQGNYLYMLSHRAVSGGYIIKMQIVNTTSWTEAFWDDVSADITGFDNGTMLRRKAEKVYVLVPVKNSDTCKFYPINGITIESSINVTIDSILYYPINTWLFIGKKIVNPLYREFPDVNIDTGEALAYKVFNLSGNQMQENYIIKEADPTDHWYGDVYIDESGWGVFTTDDMDWNTILYFFKLEEKKLSTMGYL